MACDTDYSVKTAQSLSRDNPAGRRHDARDEVVSACYLNVLQDVLDTYGLTVATSLWISIVWVGTMLLRSEFLHELQCVVVVVSSMPKVFSSLTLSTLAFFVFQTASISCWYTHTISASSFNTSSNPLFSFLFLFLSGTFSSLAGNSGRLTWVRHK